MSVLILLLFLLAYAAVSAADYGLDWLNYKHLLRHGGTPPDELRDVVDQELLKKTSEYNAEKMLFSFFESGSLQVVTFLFIMGGILSWYDGKIAALGLPFALSGTVYMLILVLLKGLVAAPFDIYRDFGIENKHGFNTMTPCLWGADFVKGMAVTMALLAVVCAAAFSLVKAMPGFWWLAVWLFFLLFSVFMMYVSPYILEPLFNKFTPLDDPALEGDIKGLLAKAGIKVSSVFKMDASKRTRHTNAYFSGIGHVKRIVLYDTLLEKLDKDELLAVLAHEAGHWKKKHILKSLALFETLSFAGFWLAFLCLGHCLAGKILLVRGVSFFAEVILLGFVSSVVLWPLAPLFNALSRRFEREADEFAVNLTGSGEHLASALVKLSKDNLSNLRPHPLYAKFHYSHPPVAERIRALRSQAPSA